MNMHDGQRIGGQAIGVAYRTADRDHGAKSVCGRTGKVVGHHAAKGELLAADAGTVDGIPCYHSVDKGTEKDNVFIT